MPNTNQAIWDTMRNQQGAGGLDALLGQLLGSYGQNAGAGFSLPQFSTKDQAMMDNQYNSEMSTQMALLKKKLMEQLGGLSASAATRGITGSSAHGRAVGQGIGGYEDALAQAMNQASQNRLNMQMALRQAMMGAQSQNLGTLSNLASNMFGQKMQGFGLMGEGDKNQVAGNAGLMASLMGIGKALPGISEAGGFADIFKGLWGR